MNIPVRHATAATKLAIVDCDIHPAFRKPSDLYPFLPARWREHMTTFGEHLRQGLSGQLAWPRMMASGLRVDAFPEDGPPGSDLDLMRRQHLDANGVEVGMLMQLSKGGMEERNLDSPPRCRTPSTTGSWRPSSSRSRGSAPASWCRRRTRPSRSARSSTAPTIRRSSQIIISPRSSDPLGHRRYWPIFEAARALQPADRAARAGLQRRPRLDRLGLADLLHGGALRRDHRHAEHADEPGVRGRVRALPEAEGRADRRRLRLGAGAVLADGQALGAHARWKRRT